MAPPPLPGAKALARRSPEILRAGERRRLADLSQDVDYLAFKDDLVEPLSPPERQRLEARRPLVEPTDEARGGP